MTITIVITAMYTGIVTVTPFLGHCSSIIILSHHSIKTCIVTKTTIEDFILALIIHILGLGTTHRIVSYSIASHNIASHRILSHRPDEDATPEV
jgi:hypothetical protein